MPRPTATAVLAALLCLLLAGCARPPTPASLTVVAESRRQWTGVAVGPRGRLFVNYPRWSDDVPFSVARLGPGGEAAPYPDEAINTWTGAEDPAATLVCVQALYVDDRDRLYILDPANPRFAGVVTGGPKVVVVDLQTDEVRRIHPLPEAVAPPQSYLNDIRVDPATETAYISESGLGALIVLDLESGRARRLLADHPSTKAEAVTLTIGGEPWLQNGQPPQVHCDGIALSPDRRWVYYQALTGRTLYRVPSAALRNDSLAAAELAGQVETLGRPGAADGMAFGPDGLLYIAAIDRSAVRVYDPRARRLRLLFAGRLAWPDSLAVGPAGWLYVTTSRIHIPDPDEPYRLWRFAPLGEEARIGGACPTGACPVEPDRER